MRPRINSSSILNWKIRKIEICLMFNVLWSAFWTEKLSSWGRSLKGFKKVAFLSWKHSFSVFESFNVPNRLQQRLSFVFLCVISDVLFTTTNEVQEEQGDGETKRTKNRDMLSLVSLHMRILTLWYNLPRKGLADQFRIARRINMLAFVPLTFRPYNWTLILAACLLFANFVSQKSK